MKLTTISTAETLAAEVAKVKAFVASADAIERQLDTLEMLIKSCAQQSGVQSPSANNLTVNLIQQLRFSTAAMFLSHSDLRDRPVAAGYEIPSIL